MSVDGTDAADDWPGAGYAVLRALMAEALAAYHVWRTLTPDAGTFVEWKNSRGWDILIHQSGGRRVRINAKRAWKYQVPQGNIAYGGTVTPDPAKVDVLALVILEDIDVRWSETGDGGVHLQAGACPAMIYFVPVGVIGTHARWDGQSQNRALISEEKIEQFADLSLALDGSAAL